MTRKPARILVVEDDVEMNDLECELLALHGFSTAAAYTGRQAMEMCQDVDAVLLDIMLPDIDGFEACRHLRRSGDKRMPIVMVTALTEDECRRRGFAAGANAYLTKPFDPDEVVDVLRTLTSRNGQPAASAQAT